MTDAFTLLSFRTDVRNLSPSIFIVVGERKIMNHFVVNEIKVTIRELVRRIKPWLRIHR
jgi:hypothetical protein